MYFERYEPLDYPDKLGSGLSSSKIELCIYIIFLLCYQYVTSSSIYNQCENL